MVRQETLTPGEERRLIDDALSGDKLAMRSLIARLSSTIVYEAARSLFRMRAMGGGGYSLSVEDLRQEILVLLFADNAQKLNAFDPGRNVSLGAYVAPIARNRLSSYLQRRSATGRFETPTEEHSAFLRSYPAEKRQILIKLLEALRADLSDLMWRTFLEVFKYEKSPKEAAVVLGTTAAGVHLRVWKIRRRARELLHEIVAVDAKEKVNLDEIIQWLASLAEPGDA